MKLFYKLLMLTVVAAVAAPFILKDGAGRPLMTLDKLHMPEISTPALPGVASTLREVASKLPDMDLDKARAKVTAYKWQDAEGVWHFSDKPDGGGEEISIDPDASVMEFDGIPVAAPATKPALPSRPREDNATQSPSLPGSVTSLMEQVRGVNQLAQDRFDRQSREIESQGR